MANTANADASRMGVESVWKHVALSGSADQPHPVVAATILRAFDDVRRELSQRVSGKDGCFPGYDVLNLDLVQHPVSALTIVGIASDIGPSSHGVHYTCLDDSGPEAACRVLATARGKTITPTEG